MKVYLGDGVYAERDALGGIILTTESGVEGVLPSNVIYLDYAVMIALQEFKEREGC